jgi:hypothetical protein
VSSATARSCGMSSGMEEREITWIRVMMIA